MSFLDRMFSRERASGTGGGGSSASQERPKPIERLGNPGEFAYDVKRKRWNEIWTENPTKGEPSIFHREPIDQELGRYRTYLEKLYVNPGSGGVKVVNSELVKISMAHLIVEMKKAGLFSREIDERGENVLEQTLLEENLRRYSKKTDLGREEAFEKCIDEGGFSRMREFRGMPEGVVPDAKALAKKYNLKDVRDSI